MVFLAAQLTALFKWIKDGPTSWPPPPSIPMKSLYNAVPGVHEAHDGADNVIVFTIPPIPPCMNSSLQVNNTPQVYYYCHQVHNCAVRIEHWEGGDKDEAEVHVLFCNVPPLRWLKSFQGCLSDTVDVMGWLFSYYVVRNISAWLDEVVESKPQILWSLCFDSWSVSPWSFSS